MKKLVVSTLLLSSMVLIGVGANAEEANGPTQVNSEVIAGDVTFVINNLVDFGQKPLDASVDFGTKPISYTVTDYSGNAEGFSVTASITGVNEKINLSVGDQVLSSTPAEVLTKSTLSFGANPGEVNSSLSLVGAESLGQYNETITWVFQKNVSTIEE